MAMFAVSAMSAVTQVMAGKAANEEAKINAGIYEQQAGFTDILSKLESDRYDISEGLAMTQFRRAKSKMTSTLTARTAGAGLEMSGTPMTVLIDNLTQMGIDEAITKYNYATEKAANVYSREQEKIGMLSTASQLRYKGKIARNTAYSNAFSTALQGAYGYGTRSGLIKTDAKKAGGQ
jgi:hypothetical protein